MICCHLLAESMFPAHNEAKRKPIIVICDSMFDATAPADPVCAFLRQCNAVLHGYELPIGRIRKQQYRVGSLIGIEQMSTSCACIYIYVCIALSRQLGYI